MTVTTTNGHPSTNQPLHRQSETVVTATNPEVAKPLPLHQRTELVRVKRTYFYCTKCHREHRFSWFTAYCNEAAELLCMSCRCGGPDLRLCRRCHQPRQLDRFGTAGQWPCQSSTCHECLRGSPATKEPLQRECECSHCETTFTAGRSDAKFCSPRCRTAAHRAALRSHNTGEHSNFGNGGDK